MPAAAKDEIRKMSSDHLDRYLETDGADGYLYYGRETLILTTIGRRSGKPVSTPLFFGRDADRYVLVGSFGGRPTHPAWYLNLLATPDVQVQVKDARFTARARTATGDERERLWQLMVANFPTYADYQASTSRELPVVLLEPR